MNKTKKELIGDLDDLMRIIAFYIDEDILIHGKQETLAKIKKQKKANKRLTMILYLISMLLLCGSCYLLGLSR